MNGARSNRPRCRLRYFRLATRQDVTPIVRILADDPIGSRRERFEEPLPEVPQSSMREIA
jgi:hypothetical protein